MDESKKEIVIPTAAQTPVEKPKQRNVRCPLCLKFMENRYSLQKNCRFWMCHIDKVSIRVDDPFVDRWDEAIERAGGKVPCPNCNADMRFFCNSTGYMKSVCPKRKCGAAVESLEPDKTSRFGETTKDLLQ